MSRYEPSAYYTDDERKGYDDGFADGKAHVVEQIVAMVPGWYIGGRLTNKAQIEQIERQIKGVLA